MAECAVTFAIQKMESLLEQELVRHRGGIIEDVTNVMIAFKTMQVLLKDADKRSEMDHDVKEWVTDLRYVAFEVENLIEEYVFQHHKQQPPVQGHWTSRSIHKIKQFFNKHLMIRRPIFARRIHFFKLRIERISERKERFNFAVTQDTTLVATAHTVVRDARQDAVFLDEVQPVGIDGPKEEFIRWLVEEPDPRLGVACVLGMGGLGKTTLVKKVWESHKVRAHFDILGWATVSTYYQAKRLLRDLVSSILEEGKELFPLLMDMEAHQLKEMLINLLRSKRYFIVIDDLMDLAAWKEIKSALPADSKCGSRIIVTTRSEEMAKSSVENSGYLFRPALLSEEVSLELFLKVAFRSNVNEHPREVIRKFLRQCGGLPLAIVSMAGFLSTKETNEWDTIFRDIELLRSWSDVPYTRIFLVIYNDLPCHLKPCLLYLCLFPKDYVIDCSRLLCLWVAEGFSIHRFNEAMTKEEVAKRYLDELIARRFIQVQDIDLCGRVRTCRIRIHDIFHEFILEIALEQDFAEFSPYMGQVNHRIRRLSIANENEDKNIFPKDKRLLHQIQSFFAYGNSSLFNSTTISLFLGGGVKPMKILDLEGVRLKKFPGEILTNLYFLRYLGINAEKFSHPSCLGRLVNLETLVLKGPLLLKLPDEILQLKCLRNLFGDLLELPKGIGGTTTLEKLNLVVGYDGIDKELGMLTRLRSLCMVCMNKEDTNFVLSSLETMAYLRSLYLRLSKPKDNVLDVHNLSHFPPLLQSLTLVGAMNDLPHQIFSLEKLTELKLSYSGVRGSALFEGLQFLPKLVELVLEMDAIDDAKLHFMMGSFSKLVTLELHGLSKLESIGIEEGAMPCIQKIRFINCPLVEHVPVGIEHLTTLKRIGLAKMASNLEGDLRSHHWTAGHSPTVKSFADEFDMDSSTIGSFVDELDTAY